MGKRLNPHRRLLERQAKALAAERMVQIATNDADSVKLQQGRVRSSAEDRIRVSRTGDVSGALTSNRPIRMAPWEGAGKRGKVVKGRFKPTKPGTKARHSEQPKGPLTEPAMNAAAVHPTNADSARLHGLKHHLLKKFRYQD